MNSSGPLRWGRFAWGLSLTLLVSCVSLKAPDPVARPAVPSTMAVPDSVLTLPIRVPLSQVSTWTQDLVPVNFSGSGKGSQTLSALLLKHEWNYWWNYDLERSPLNLSFEGSSVLISTQLKGNLSARWDTVPGQATAPVEATASVKLDVGLNESWKLVSHSRVGIDIKKATLPLGFTLGEQWIGWALDIAQPLREAIQPVLGPLGRELDTRLADLDLQSPVRGVWNELQKSRQLPGTESLWFNVRPTSVAISPLEFGSNWIGLRLQLTAQTGITLGSPEEAVPVPLPPLKKKNSLRDGFSMALKVNLSWEEAVRQALAKMPQNRTFKLPQGGSLQVMSLRANTDADRVLVRVEATVTPAGGAGVPAVLWVAARPLWDASTNHLRLVDAQLDVQTQDFLAQVATWLLQKSWISELEKTWDWDLGPELKRTREQMSSALAKQPLADHLMLSVNIDSMKVNDLRLADSGPEALVQIRGAGVVEWRP